MQITIQLLNNNKLFLNPTEILLAQVEIDSRLKSLKAAVTVHQIHKARALRS